MNRINNLFLEKKKNILSVYFTAGFPKISDTEDIIKWLSNAGADIIEIGIPFSDPLADGPVIQNSGNIALKNGMTLKLLFEQLKNIRQHTQIPLILMGYLNPILQFGFNNFCKKAKEVGVDGFILPDLPIDQYQENYLSVANLYDLKNIFLITPQTSTQRIQLIDSISSGFIYMVSSASVTGSKKKITNEQLDYFQRIKNMKLQNPTLIGFGISDKTSFESACKYAQGAIIGSAFIKTLAENNNLETNIGNFITQIKDDNKTK